MPVSSWNSKPPRHEVERCLAYEGEEGRDVKTKVARCRHRPTPICWFYCIIYLFSSIDCLFVRRRLLVCRIYGFCIFLWVIKGGNRRMFHSSYFYSTINAIPESRVLSETAMYSITVFGPCLSCICCCLHSRVLVLLPVIRGLPPLHSKYRRTLMGSHLGWLVN